MWFLTQWPHFLRLCSHRISQAFGSVSLTPVCIWYWSVPRGGGEIIMYVTATYKINIKVIRNYFVASVVHVNPRQTKGYCTGSITLKANCKYKFLYSLYSTIEYTKRRKTERDRKLVHTAFVLKAKRWPLKSFVKSPTINTFRLEETVYRVFWK